jgi:hypothetical protein
MDVYSFSLLCIWILKFDQLDHIPIKSIPNLPNLVRTLEVGMAPAMQELLLLGLRINPAERISDFRQIAETFGSTRYHYSLFTAP